MAIQSTEFQLIVSEQGDIYGRVSVPSGTFFDLPQGVTLKAVHNYQSGRALIVEGNRGHYRELAKRCAQPHRLEARKRTRLLLMSKKQLQELAGGSIPDRITKVQLVTALTR